MRASVVSASLRLALSPRVGYGLLCYPFMVVVIVAIVRHSF